MLMALLPAEMERRKLLGETSSPSLGLYSLPTEGTLLKRNGNLAKKMASEPNVVVQACNLSYPGGRDRRIMVQGLSGQKHKTLSEKQTKAKD
jgi:hypothetical protein